MKWRSNVCWYCCGLRSSVNMAFYSFSVCSLLNGFVKILKSHWHATLTDHLRLVKNASILFRFFVHFNIPLVVTYWAEVGLIQPLHSLILLITYIFTYFLTCVLTYILTCLCAYLFAYFFSYLLILTCVLTFLLTCVLTSLLTCVLTYIPSYILG